MSYREELKQANKPQNLDMRATIQEQLVDACAEVDRLRAELLTIAIRLEPHYQGAMPKGTIPTAAWILLEIERHLRCVDEEYRAELAEARKDSERLDWLEKQHRLECKSMREIQSDTVTLLVFDETECTRFVDAKSYRAAIDAARAQSGAPEREEGST